VTNDRYINDQQVGEAITAQLGKVGIKLNLAVQSKNIVFPMVDKYECAMFMLGLGLPSWNGAMNMFYREKKDRYGSKNRGRFKDPELEKRIQEVTVTMDSKKREKLAYAVTADAMATNYVIPMYYEEAVMGFNKRATGNPRVDEFIYAHLYKKAK
jgi:peptide/nickel transport system substrate-binding protein